MQSGELKPIILYDIPCITPGLPWSPNTMKTRYCLGYKGLPFTTVWVELPDIAGLLQSKGAAQPPFTLPAIEDPNTGALVIDSVAIAAYLDKTYPETPVVLTPAAREVLEGIEKTLSFVPRDGTTVGVSTSTHALGDGKSDVPCDLAPRLVFVVLNIERLNQVSRVHYNQIRGALHAERWTALIDACAAGGEERAERVRQGIEAISGGWGKVTALYGLPSESGEGTPGRLFAFGEEPCFLDFVIAARVKFALNALNPSEAEILKGLQGGKLGELVEDLGKYYKY